MWLTIVAVIAYAIVLNILVQILKMVRRIFTEQNKHTVEILQRRLYDPRPFHDLERHAFNQLRKALNADPHHHLKYDPPESEFDEPNDRF